MSGTVYVTVRVEQGVWTQQKTIAVPMENIDASRIDILHASFEAVRMELGL